MAQVDGGGGCVSTAVKKQWVTPKLGCKAKDGLCKPDEVKLAILVNIFTCSVVGSF